MKQKTSKCGLCGIEGEHRQDEVPDSFEAKWGPDEAPLLVGLGEHDYGFYFSDGTLYASLIVIFDEGDLRLAEDLDSGIQIIMWGSLAVKFHLSDQFKLGEFMEEYLPRSNEFLLKMGGIVLSTIENKIYR